MKTILCCYGTRPEFIKIAPVVSALKKYTQLKTLLMCSGQHKELLKGMDHIFGLANNYDLRIRAKIGTNDDLSLLGSHLILAFSKKLEELIPDAVVVQGDAASTFYAALAAFQQRIPVFYIEAGLRTYDLSKPFPEEGYRQMITRIAEVCFAPTETSRKNLIYERVAKSQIHVVGNTIVDALKKIRARLTSVEKRKLLEEKIPQLKRLGTRKLVVVEIHRRENYKKPLIQILTALLLIQAKHPDYFFVFSVHPSPNIKPIVNKFLKGTEEFLLINPPDYLTFIALLELATLVITDSGGLQEEIPTFGIPAMVTREKTERVEGLSKGWVTLVGFDKNKILESFESIKNWEKPLGGNPFGDGKAAERIAKSIYEYFY